MIILINMRAIRQTALRLIKPRVYLNPTVYKFCSQTKVISNLSSTMLQHRHNCSTDQLFLQYFTDSKLLFLVQSNYCLMDVVNIASKLIYLSKSQNFTNIQAIFLAYVYNLFFSDMKRGKEMLILLGKNIRNKINSKQFNFQNQEVESAYLSKIIYLTNRNNPHLQREIHAIKVNMNTFVCLKFKVMEQEEKFSSITRNSIDNLISIVPYLCKDTTNQSIVKQLQKYYLNVLKQQTDSFIGSKDQQISAEFMKEQSIRFTKFMQFGIAVSKLQDKFINIFQSLPIFVTSEIKLVAYLKLLRDFFSYQMIKRIDYQQFDQFNYCLADNHKSFKSPAAVKSFEDYVQSLIALKISNVRFFSPFFEQFPWVYDQSKATKKGKLPWKFSKTAQ